jgi:hypothetical protein
VDQSLDGNVAVTGDELRAAELGAMQ